jgi:hypothetical protein
MIRSALPFCWEVYGHEKKKCYSMLLGKGVKDRIIKLATIVALYGLEGRVKLCQSQRMKR